MPSAEDARKATVDALRAALGEGRVTSCLDEADSDPRTAAHVSGRSVGRPLCWTRPETTAHCAAIVRIARAHGAAVCPVGEATTFWDGLRVGDAIALDATTLRNPLEIDPVRRLAWAGAGCSVRSVDRAASGGGFCALASHPDTAGDTPLGSLVAVGSTAGRGLGTILPIDQVTGATLVLGTGEIVRAGAAHSLGGPSFLRHGLPDLLGLLTAAEGRAAVLTEVGLALRPAPFLVRGRGRRAPLERAPDVDLVMDLLAVARRGMDRGTLATFRLELTTEGAGAGPASLDVLFECVSTRTADDAWAEAAILRDEVAPLLEVAVPLEPETERARAGSLPEYDERFDVAPGQHRRRIEGGAFWGAEAATSWGTELGACLEQLLAVYARLGDAAPAHRRLGVYPAPHGVSAGVVVLAGAEPARLEQTVQILSGAQRHLLATGAVPYRTGNLWSGGRHGEAALDRGRHRHLGSLQRDRPLAASARPRRGSAGSARGAPRPDVVRRGGRGRGGDAGPARLGEAGTPRRAPGPGSTARRRRGPGLAPVPRGAGGDRDRAGRDASSPGKRASSVAGLPRRGLARAEGRRGHARSHASGSPRRSWASSRRRPCPRGFSSILRSSSTRWIACGAPRSTRRTPSLPRTCLRAWIRPSVPRHPRRPSRASPRRSSRPATSAARRSAAPPTRTRSGPLRRDRCACSGTETAPRRPSPRSRRSQPHGDAPSPARPSTSSRPSSPRGPGALAGAGGSVRAVSQADDLLTSASASSGRVQPALSSRTALARRARATAA